MQYKEENLKLSYKSLNPFAKHIFSLYEDNRLEEMKKSIKEQGIITPLIVRFKDEDTYEILSGHNRWNAVRLLNESVSEYNNTDLPCRVLYGVSDDDALEISVITNLNQRGFDDLKFSERAKALKIYKEEIRNKGKEVQVEPQGKASKKVADFFNLSDTNVIRYIKLLELIEPLLNRVDNGEIKFIPAYDLTFLTEEQQNMLNMILNEKDEKDNNKYTVSLISASKIKENSKKDDLNEDKIREILTYKKTSYNIKKLEQVKYLTQNGYTEEDVMVLIYKYLDTYIDDAKDGNANENKLKPIKTIAPTN